MIRVNAIAKQLFWLSGFVFLGFTMLNSCNESESETETKKTEKRIKRENAAVDTLGIIRGNSQYQYVGKAGQLVVVSDNTIFTKEIDSLFSIFFGAFIEPYYPAFPKFELRHISPEKFEKGNKRLRSIVELNLDDKLNEGKPELRIKKDMYAKHQIIAEFRANNMNDLLLIIEQESPRLVELFESLEWKREYHRFKKDNNTVLKSALREQFGITLELPKNARYESVKSRFAKITFPDRSRQMDFQSDGGYNSSKANFIQSGLMIWQLPFRDSSQLTHDYLMRARDTILKYNAFHEFPGVYMGTQDHPAVLPVSKQISIGGVNGFEFRGMYKFTGRLEPSGGKFWSFHFLHPKRNMIVAISGYLDAPPTMSPALDMRKIQAAIYSLQLE